MKIILTRTSRALTKSGLHDVDYALNPYAGCWHACLYCYAPGYTRYRVVARNWGEVIVVKVNLPEILAREVRTVKPGIVGVGTITDPYQPVEAAYRVTERSLRILLEHGFTVSIQTKNTLILRDMSLLEDYKNRVDIGVTITSLNERRAMVWEPRAPPPKMRAKILYEAYSREIESWIFLGPIIPGYNDDIDSIEEIVLLAKETKSRLYYDRLRVKKFMEENSHPVSKLLQRLASYDWSKTYRVIESLCRKHGVNCMPAFPLKTGLGAQSSGVKTLDQYL